MTICIAIDLFISGWLIIMITFWSKVHFVPVPPPPILMSLLFCPQTLLKHFAILHGPLEHNMYNHLDIFMYIDTHDKTVTETTARCILKVKTNFKTKKSYFPLFCWGGKALKHGHRIITEELFGSEVLTQNR